MRDTRLAADGVRELSDALTFRLRLNDLALQLQPAPVMTISAPSDLPLADLQHLPTDALVVLLTPFTAPAGWPNTFRNPTPTKSTGGPLAQFDTDRVDPFEFLRHSLVRRHLDVRQVPYLPMCGWTQAFDEWLDRADAFVVVTCQPLKSFNSDVTPLAPAHEILRAPVHRQMDFVNRVEHVLRGIDRELPMVNLHFGGTDELHWDATPNSCQHIHVADEYNPGSIVDAASLLFGEE